MMKKLIALCLLTFVALVQRPHAQAGTARIYFVDIGQGAGTLIVSPAGKTLLVDGGPPGGGTKIGALLDTLGIATIDYTVLTHYHIDHDSGLMELLNAGRVAGIAYDNGDDPAVQPPGTSTSSASTRGTYLNYVTATGHAGVTRQTITPGQVIDLGGGMKATCLAAAGHFLSGGSVAITNDDLNSESISLLVEFNNFDFIISGDLTGGGSTSTAKTPDVETYVGQLAGDVDVAQINHHGSTTTSNQVYLSAVKAEVAVAQAGTTNTFGHPNRETVNKYLNTPVTTGNVFAGTGRPPAGVGPVFYQHEESPSGDDRVTQQGYTGASAADAGHGTLLLETDGTTTYSIKSFDDGGTLINPAAHTYPVDGVSPGITTDFPPTVIVQTAPVAPLATDSVVVSAAVNDRESPITSVVLNYALNGAVQSPLAMTLLSGNVYQATIPAEPDGTRVDFAVTGSTGGQTTAYSSGYFSGTTLVAALRTTNTLGEPLYTGYAARIQGTVTAGSNTFASGTNDDYIQDATGGINVYRSTDTPTPFSSTAPGQVAEAVGRIGFNGGRQRLDLTESIEKMTSPFGINVLSSGPAPTPASVTIAALSLNPESYEGQLVSIANCQIVSGALPVTPQSLDTFVTISDSTGTFSLKVDHDTDIEGFNPGTTFTVVGIIQQDDYLRPFDSGYNIAPRGRADLGGTAAGATLVSIAAARIDAINNADGTPGADFVPDLLNQLVKVRGAVTSIDFRGGNGIEYYIQDATGGIDLFNTSQNFGPFSIGDSVEAIGLVTQFNGLTELTVSSVSGLPPGTIAAATPQVVTLSQLADGGVGEPLEGRLIRVDNVTITSGAYPAGGASGNLTIADSTGSAVMRIDSDTNIDGTPTPSGTLSVTGVLGQFDSSSPFDSGYQLMPRSLADITVSGASAITVTPTSYDFGSLPVGGTAFTSITITNVSGSSVTLTTPFTLTGANPDQFSVGTPGTTTLAAGAATPVTVNFLPTSASPATKSVTLNIGSSGGPALVSLTGTAQTSGGGGAGSPVVISEFRFRGPSGGNDEFVEIYNNSDGPVDISGWRINGSNNAGTTSTRATVPASTSLPARRHYLFTNSGTAGYSGAVTGNMTYATGITDDGGVALLKAAPDNTVVDQVGLSAGSAYKEGNPLPNLGTTTASNLNHSYERKLGGVNGSQQDTNDNLTDFAVRDAPPGGSGSDPQNLASPPTPGIAVSPTSINFGSVVVGGMVSLNVTITNLNSAASVDLGSLSLGGDNPASFIVGPPGTTTIGPGGFTTASVTFQPPSGGMHAAKLTVPTVSNGSATIALSGTATGGITVDPLSIDFGTQAVGSLSGATLTISADSSVTLTPPFVVSGTNAAEFFVGAPSTTTIGPGNDATVAVGFQPASVGPKTASVLVSSIDGGSRNVTLVGSVACPTISISGSLPNGIFGAAYSQTLVGSGGTSPYTFTTSTGALPPGQSLASSGTVSGAPTATGSFSATIRATDANSCFSEASYTIGITSATLTANPATLNFGVVTAGSPVSKPVTITNTSSFSVTLSTPFTITGGAGSAQFSAGLPSTNILAAGASTDVQITFAPTVAGIASATLTVTSSNGGTTTAALSGTGRQVSVGGPIVISELRFRGAGGASDEFVEIYNNSDASVDISGFLLKGSNATGTVSTRATVPSGKAVPARAHYLFVNSVASATLVSLADQTYATGFTDDGGVAIARGDGTIVDQVGLSAGSAYGEGTPLASLGTTNVDHSYERKPGGANGNGIDTNDNASDFALIAPSVPQNLASVITPALATSPAPIDFGSTARGTSSDAVVTIVNNDTHASISLSTPFAISGTNAADFSVGAPGSTTVNAGTSTTSSVTFQPTTLGNKTATLTISGTNGETHVVALSGISTCPVISIAATLPNVEAGVPYSQVLTASGGIEPYRFEVVSGTLPAGLSLSPGGVLSGTTTATGVFTFTVQATEDDGSETGCSNTATFSLTVGDTASPGIVCAVPDGAWHAGNVALACTATDSGSGLANPADASFSLVTSVGAGSENANAATTSRTVCDVSGNCATAGPVGGNKIDRKDPAISITMPSNGAVYELNQAVSASYGCSDTGSGLSTCAGPVASGSPINTSTLGAKTFVVNATDSVGNASSLTVSYEVRRTLTAVGPAKIWVGLKNSDEVGLRLDLRAEVLVNGALAASGELMNVSGGSSGFNNALLQSFTMSLASGAVDVPAGAHLSVRVMARRTCASNGHNSGTAREWFNGQPIDSGVAPDAGSRVPITMAGATNDYFLRNALALAMAAGSSRQSVDTTVSGAPACPARPFVPFGEWSTNLP
jgi:beta-lactamase superfamily II metal-dependent hydrolase